MMDSRIVLTFLGSASVVPEVGRDTASVLINQQVLVDTGWCSALRMLEFGVTPLDLGYIFLTHGHHDHFLGLAHLLFYRAMRKDDIKRPIQIVGPADLPMILEHIRTLTMAYRHPKAWIEPAFQVLMPGDVLEVDTLSVEACQTVHPVDGRCYRFADRVSGRSVVLAWDTAYHKPIAAFAQGADLLVHEASFPPDPEKYSPESLRSSGHSTAIDAARIAKAAQVKRLVLIHYSLTHIDRSLEAAKAIFPETYAVRDGETIVL